MLFAESTKHTIIFYLYPCPLLPLDCCRVCFQTIVPAVSFTYGVIVRFYHGCLSLASAEEELKMLLDSSTDDFDFLIPTILDGSSTGLEGASGVVSSKHGESRSRPGGFMLEVRWLLRYILPSSSFDTGLNATKTVHECEAFILL